MDPKSLYEPCCKVFSVVLFAVLFFRIPVDLYPTPFKVTLTFTGSIEDTETTVTEEMKTSAVKQKGHAYCSTFNMELKKS